MADGVLQSTDISQKAQDVAKANSVSYEDIAKQAENTATPTYADYNSTKVSNDINQKATAAPAASYIDTAKSTVAGQLNSLLSSDSPYITQAESKSQQQSASRGLLNSTLAAQAGRTAAINAALPIAQQDADTYKSFGLQQQASDNTIKQTQAEAIVSGEMLKQKSAIEQQAQNTQNAFNARLTGASEESKVWLQDLSQQHDVAMQQMQDAQNSALQEYSVSATTANAILTQSSTIMQNYQISVENLLTDPDFLNLGSTAVTNAINQLQGLAKNSIKFLGSASGIDMSPFVDTYLSALSI